MTKLKPLPWTPTLTAEERHARHIVRLFKQGVTMFRIKARGHIVQIHEIDAETGMAFGRGLRGRNRKAPLADLVPMTYTEQS